MPTDKEACTASLLTSINASQLVQSPYNHWFMQHCLPDDVVNDVLSLPFEAPSLGGISGKRELHNDTRRYFNAASRGQFPVAESVAQAFQDPRLTRRMRDHFGAKLNGTFLRIEYAQDTDGFWLEPHTDLGVKALTILVYLSKDAQHHSLGTDLYDENKKHVGRSPFVSNNGMVFVPSSTTYHGFEPRKIEGLRLSLIVNYVTNEWRAREQLAFPESPVTL